MARHDLSSRDASVDAASEIERLLQRSKREENPVQNVPVEQALSGKPVFRVRSDREVTRVLFISQNANLLNPTQQSLDGYLNLSELFDEVHILILREGIPPKNPSLRVSDNVWIYTVSTRYWWWAPKVALRLLEEQLVFANGFRADLIVARDPFESAVVAHKISEKYGRPAQLHVLEDYQARSFLHKLKSNFWRRYVARYTIPHFQSVRTATESVLTYIKTKFNPVDIQMLPKFHDYESLITTDEYIDLKATYRPHIIFLLYAGKLNHDSGFLTALNAARFVLQNPRVALVALGEGNGLREFRRKARGLRVSEQVVFETKAPSVVPYLKTADILIVTDTDLESEDLVLKAAAAGIPMVMTKTEFREDVFINGVSAYMCDADNQESFTQFIDELLNKPELREKFAKNSQEIIRKKFHTDPNAYREAYRESIEGALFVEADTQTD